jgi:hypothetical protein
MMGILAQTIDRQFYLRSMHQQFSRSDPHIWQEILLGLAIVGGIVALAWVAWYVQSWSGQKTQAGPMSLYRNVLGRMDLPPGDLWRLWRLAKVVHMPHPTAVLISAELYDEAVKEYGTTTGWLGSRRSAAAQFAGIRARLFTGAS